MLNQGETSDDKLDNALTAYNQLFNIYNNIIDLDAHSKTKQQIKYTYTETKKVEITIAKSGSWQEWDPNKIPTSFITKLKEQHADLDVPSDLDLNDPENWQAFFKLMPIQSHLETGYSKMISLSQCNLTHLKKPSPLQILS